MLKVYRCKKTRKVRYSLENRFGIGHCDDLKKLRKGLSYEAGMRKGKERYHDRIELRLDRHNKPIPLWRLGRKDSCINRKVA